MKILHRGQRKIPIYSSTTRRIHAFIVDDGDEERISVVNKWNNICQFNSANDGQESRKHHESLFVCFGSGACCPLPAHCTTITHSTLCAASSFPASTSVNTISSNRSFAICTKTRRELLRDNVTFRCRPRVIYLSVWLQEQEQEHIQSSLSCVLQYKWARNEERHVLVD